MVANGRRIRLFVLAAVVVFAFGFGETAAAAASSATSPSNSLCKGGTWEALGFENQGACVAHEARGLLWDLTTAYRMAPNQANPNPDRYGDPGVWSFVAVEAGSQQNPGAYQTLDYYNIGQGPHASQEGWEYSPIIPPGTPWAYPNVHAQAWGDRIGVHPGRVNLDPEYVAVSWISQISGTVAIQGSLRDGDEAGLPGSGCPKSVVDGVVWELRSSTSGVSTLLASGSFGDGGGQALPTLKTEVAPGTTISVLVGPGRNFLCDSTTLSLTLVGDPTPGRSNASGRFADGLETQSGARATSISIVPGAAETDAPPKLPPDPDGNADGEITSSSRYIPGEGLTVAGADLYHAEPHTSMWFWVPHWE